MSGPTGELVTYLKAFPFSFLIYKTSFLLIQMLAILASKSPGLETQNETIK